MLRSFFKDSSSIYVDIAEDVGQSYPKNIKSFHCESFGDAFRRINYYFNGTFESRQNNLKYTINEGTMRRVASSEEFFDILDQMQDNKFVTIGYVSSANLDVPKVKRINPLTNRMKGYDDYSIFRGGDDEDEIGALVKITSYNMRYRKRSIIGKQYDAYKKSANDIRAAYGLEAMQDKESYKAANNWGNGIEMYKGGNDELIGHSYNPQNIYGVKPKSVVYAVNKEGHIIKALTPEQVKPYLAAKREISGVAALKKLGADEATINNFKGEIDALKMKYINFEANSILYIAATVNGEKLVYINDNIMRTVNDINIDPSDFIAVAKERYKQDLATLQEMIDRENTLIKESEMKREVLGNFKELVNKINNADKRRLPQIYD